MKQPEHDPTSIGNLARIFAKVSDPAIESALHMQRTQGLPLGECLVKSGDLSPTGVRRLLGKQHDMRTSPARKDVLQVLDYAVHSANACMTGLADLLRDTFKR